MFLIIDSIGHAWYTRHNARRFAKSEKEYEQIIADADEMSAKCKEAVAQTVRFGIQDPLGTVGGSDDYRKWYSWWKNYIKGLPDDDWRRCDNAVCEGEDVSKWRPEGSWKDFAATF